MAGSKFLMTQKNFSVRDDGDGYTLFVRDTPEGSSWSPVATVRTYPQVILRLMLVCSEVGRDALRREVASLIPDDQFDLRPAAGVGGISVHRNDGSMVALCYGYQARDRAVSSMIESAGDDLSLLGEVVEAFLNATSLQALVRANAERYAKQS